MADQTYSPKVYKKDGGDTLVVASGGQITLEAGAIVAPEAGVVNTGGITVLTALFTEDATSLTHTATFTIPAGATLLDIYAIPQVLWTGGTAALSIGDANSATGWANAFDLKATDLILGERFQASNANNWGTKNGTYLTTAGRFGQQSTNMIGGYCPTAYSVIAVVTVGTPATTAGRLWVHVVYAVRGITVTPVLA